jgi:hypothetical protein
MRRSSTLLLVVLALSAGLLPAASATTPTPPPGISANVDFLGNVPEAARATAINFLTYGQGRNQRTVMVAVGRFGVKAYDLANPAKPRFLSEVTSDQLRLPSDPPPDARTNNTFWQSEDTDVDHRRKLVFLARDPRAYAGSATRDGDPAGVYTIDASNPERLRLRSYVEVGAGHTATCVNACDYLWVGGPASADSQRPQWPGGRPILVVDMRNPDAPTVLPDAVDLFRNDGVSAYAHDVQVDAAGIAWVSGAGGVRGYYTDGLRWDPVRNVRRRATAADPVPYAGGKVGEAAAPTGFMHNSLRAVNATAKDGPRSNFGHRADELILATEEQFSDTQCRNAGKLSISSIRGSYDGEGWRSTPQNPFRLETVSTWTPFDKEGYVETSSFCSAHYFDMSDRVLAYAFYDQGTRFVDISDPTNPIQVGYFRPDATNVWAAYFHNGYVYVADHVRGIDILRLNAGAKKASERRQEVRAPRKNAAAEANGRALRAQFAPDPAIGACLVPRA